MDFDDLDRRMRVFETADDYCVLPGIFIVARIDGRNFTRLTKETHSFEVPFDERMRDYMIGTTRHLMECGFRIIYGYTQSDEISLLFHPQESTFGRKTRKLNSILAGEASAQFSILLGDVAAFDCRVSQLPRPEDVIDYFRWRSEDARRNALNGHCYWMLRQQGKSATDATDYLSRMSVADKNELLFGNNINFNDLPNWQKRGVGLLWETYTKEASNPLTGQAVTATRRRIKVEIDLPMRDEYSAFIGRIVNQCLIRNQ
ncbi:MAG: guanylyltransferase [Anaerolineae bacterium]|nr:guanylyltransferase [Anaerolineae bacterium]